MSLPSMPSDPKPRRPQGAALLGRRIALGLYWMGILYITVVGFASLIPQVFWPQPTSADSVLKDPGECAPKMHALGQELRVHAKASLFATESEDAAFFAQWDQQLWGLRDTCSNRTSHYRELERLRYKTEIRLAQSANDEGKIMTTIRQKHQ